MANTNRTDIHESFLHLVRLGIGTGTVNGSRLTVQGPIDWTQLKALADEQGLTAVVLDGIDRLQLNSLVAYEMPLEMKLEWIGEVLQNYEQRYKQYQQAIGTLAEFYNQRGFKMMVLKGYACSLDWPKPEHRPCGDIDIWLFGQQKEADKALAASFKFQDSGFKIDSGHHHHTVFNWQGFTVENHYDFVNIHAHKTGKEQEAIFKELGQDDSYSVEVNGEKVYLPSPNLHALFLIRHLANHFSSMEITLRQVLDWAFFVEKHTKKIDWQWLVELLEKFHLKNFYNCINAICVGDLGFNVKIFPNVQFDPNLKERILNEIVCPSVPNEMPKDMSGRLVWKYRRWKASEWKRKLVYDESSWSAFWSGVKSHLLKPASI